MASYTALMNIQVDSQQAQLGINNLNKNLIYLSRSSRLTNKSLLQMQQTFLRIENTINQATGNTAAFNGKMQQAMNIIKKLRGEVSSLRSEVTKLNDKLKGTQGPLDKNRTLFERLALAIQKNQYFASLAVSAFAGFISQNLITGIIRLTDEYTLMQNKIRTVTPTLEGAKSSMEAVYRISQDTRQPLSIVANMFSRIGRNSKELRENLAGLTDVVGTVSKAFQIGGATIEESRNAMVQFSQALASGRLQGDELRSILELAPVLATSISKSIGITTGSLRKLASEGLITTEVLIKALFESGKAIREDFQKMMPTVEQSVETVKNSFTRLIGENEKFKAANNALSLSLRDFSRALEEQGGIADQLGSVYLGLARNIDIIAAAVVGLTTAIAGLAILGVGAIAAANPIVAAAFGITALVSGFGAYIGITKSAEERTKNLAKEIDRLSSVSDEDVSKMSKEDSQKRLSDIMKAQSETVDLVRKEQSLIEEINQELEKGEKEIEKQRSLGASEFYIEHMRTVQALENAALLDEKKMHELRLEDFKKYLEELNRLYDEQIKIEEGKALELMLARTRAMEMQKRLLKEQERDEQISYFGSFGSGASEKQLKDIQFANKAAQDLRKTLSDLQMSTLDTAFVGRLSVETLFGSTNPAAAVENLKSKITEFIQLTETDPAGGIVQFFTNYMGEEGKKQIEEISTKLKEQPLLAKGIKEGMITVWKEALANYEIYKAERDAGEERFIALKKKDLQFESKEQQAIFNAERQHLNRLLDESATIHDANTRAVIKETDLRAAQILIELESKEISSERAKELTSELQTLNKINTQLAEQAVRAKAVNEILQNREKIRVGKSTQEATAEVGGFESFGGTGSYDLIGSALRDINIQYKVQLSTIEAIYGKSSRESIELRTQEGILKNINIQKKISEVSDSVRLDTARQMVSNEVLGRETQLQEQGLNDSEIKIKLLEEESQLTLDSLQYLGKEGEELRKNVGLLYDERIETEKLQKIREDLAATYAERAVGEAVVDGAQALFSGETYTKLYDSIVSGANYLMEGINKIEWSKLGEDLANGIKDFNFSDLSKGIGGTGSFQGDMKALAGSGLFQGIASAGGASGQRALNIAQAGAAGGPYAALGAAILSNEKVQEALSKLFDAVFEFIDPFLDLLGPVVDIFTAMLKNNPIMTAVNALKPFLESLGNAISGLAAAIAALDLGSKGGTLGYIFGGGLGSDLEEGFNKLANIVGLGYQSGKKDFIAGDTVIDIQKSLLTPIFEDIDYVFEHGFRRFSDDPSVRGLIDQNFDQLALTSEAADQFLKDVERVGFDEALEGVSSTMKEQFDKIQNLYIHGYDKHKVERNAKFVQDELTRLLTETYFGEILQEFKDRIQGDIDSINDEIKSRDFFNFESVIKGLNNELDELGMPEGFADQAREKIEEFKLLFINLSKTLADEKIFDISMRGLDLTKEQELDLKYDKEKLEVLRNTNYTTSDQNRIINALNKAREREVAAMEREQELLNLQGAQSALAEILNTFEKTMKGIQDLINSLFEQIRDLLFSEFNLDPAFKKMEGAAIIYGDLLEKALDSEATIEDIERLQGFVNTYLSSARDLYKSSSAFQEIFDQVLNDLNEIGITAPAGLGLKAISIAELDLEEVAETIDVSLEPLLDELNRMKNALAKQLTDFENFKLNADIQAGIEIVDEQGNPITNLIKSVGADLVLVGSDGVTEISEVIAYANGKLELIDEQNNVVSTIEVSATGVPVLKDANGNVTGNLEFNAQGNLVIVDSSGNEIGSIRKEIAAEIAILDKNGSPVTELLPAIELGDVKIVDQYNNEIGKITKTIEGEILVVDNNNNPLTNLIAKLPGGITLTQDGKVVDTLTTTATGQIVLTNSKVGDVYLIDAGKVSAQVGLENPVAFAGNVTAYAGLNNTTASAGKITGTVGLNTGNLTWQYISGVGWTYTTSAGNVTATASLNNSSANAGSITGTASLNNPYQYVSGIGWRYVHNAGSVYVTGNAIASFDTSSFTTAMNNLIKNIQDSILDASKKLNIIYSMASQSTGPASYNYSYLSPTFVNSGYMAIASSYSNAESATDYQYAQSLTRAYESVYGTEVPSSFKYIVVSRRTDSVNWKQIYAYKNLETAQAAYNNFLNSNIYDANKYGFQKGGLVPGPMDTIPAMLAPGEYIMSQGAVNSIGIETLNSLNAGDLSALRQTGDPEVRSLLRELIIAVKNSDTEVNVYTDMRGEAKAAIGEFRTELRERSRRQGEKYVNVRYV